ncbi:MAG: translocation/assembly module TamB domain-containing protein [Bradymonadaceae bacterium]
MPLLDEIEFKVYRSHIKIPLIFFVPAILLASMYVLLYLYMNSNTFLRTLEAQLHAGFGGHFEVGRLVVEPSLVKVHVYDGRLLTPERETVIEVEQVQASVSPLLVLGRRIEFEKGEARGALVRIEFDENGDLNILKSLGLHDRERDRDDSERASVSVGFSDVRIVDSRFEFVDSRFSFTIPDVNIERGSIFIEPATILMTVDSLDVDHVDFAFRPELFTFEESYGPWEFSLRDFKLLNWRWANEGFAVEHLSGDVEGFGLEVAGRMAFPTGEGKAQMLYEARGKLSAPYWSPLLQYFTRGNVHFDIPELEVAVEGTLETIAGELQVHASIVEAGRVFFHDLRANLSLQDRFLVLRQGEASFHGGHIELPFAYFNLLETRYGATANVDGVNPASVLRDLEIDFPWLEGEVTGSMAMIGEFPRNPSHLGDSPYTLMHYASARYADVVMTSPVRWKRYNRELLPMSEATLKEGSTVWANMDLAVIPRAEIQVGPDLITLENYRLHYPTMMLQEYPKGTPTTLHARIEDVAAYAPYYGADGLRGGLNLTAHATGFLGAPSLRMKAKMSTPAWEFETRTVTLDDLIVDLSLDRKGELEITEALMRSPVGNASIAGTLGLLQPLRPGEAYHEREDLYIGQRRQAMDLRIVADSIDLLPFGKIFAPELELMGTLDGEADLGGSVQSPEGSFGARLRKGSIQGQHLVAADVTGTFDHDALRLDWFRVDADRAGQLEGKGHLGWKGALGFEVEGKDMDLDYVQMLTTMPMAPSGTGDFHARGGGTVNAPELSGGARVRGLALGGRHVGDVAAVADTVDQTIHLAGSVLPHFTVSLEIPLAEQESYYARVGMEGLNVMQAFPELRTMDVFDDIRATGMVELFMDRDFGSYQALAYLTEVSVDTLGQTIRNRGPIIAGVSNGEILQIQQATLGTAGRFVSLQGGMVFDPALIDLRIEGDLDLGILNSLRTGFPEFFPDFFLESHGYVMVDTTIRGTPDTLIADGQMSFGNSEFHFRQLPEPLVITSGQVLFDRDGIEIPTNRPITANALGGIARLAGDIGFEDNRPRTLDLSLWSHNMSYRITDLANFSFDTNLRLTASDIDRYETYLVSGDMNILDGLYYQEIQLVEKQLAGRVMGAFNRRTERYEASLVDLVPALNDIRWDLAIRARDGFRLRNQVDRLEMDLELRVDIVLRDTLPDPRITGNVDVIDGSVSFQGEKFEVRSGSVRFESDPGNPHVDIIAGADIRNTCRESDFADELSSAMTLSSNIDSGRQQYYHIVLNVRGYLDNLDIHFESSPYADQRDILSMLLTGCTVDQLTASSASRPTLEIALGPLLGRLEREIQDVVKVEEFTIMPGVERTQVRIGDTLTRRLSWRFQLDTGFAEATGGQHYQLEYKLSDKWSAELSERSRSETNSFLIDLKLKYRLPLD